MATLPGTEVPLMDGLEALLVPIDQVIPDAANPRTTRNLEALIASIQRFGVRKPIVVNRNDNIIEAGHQTRSALLELGATHIPVVWANDDRLEAVAFNIADNRSAEVVATWDDEALAKLLTELEAEDGLVGVGYDESDLGSLMDQIQADQAAAAAAAGEAPAGPVDEAPAPPEDPVAQPGDVWHLGKHRLFCVDARELAACLGPETTFELLLTDPPYGVDYTSKDDFLKKVHNRKTGTGGLAVKKAIQNDAASDEELDELWHDVFKSLLPNASPGASYYICAAAGDKGVYMANAFKRAGWPLRHAIVWVKNNWVLSRTCYNYRHEIIFFGWTPGAAHRWYGAPAGDDTVWEIDAPQHSKLHPTMKPLELLTRALKNSTKRGDVIVDPFLGSGSTLVAAHAAGRVCYGSEIDPAYVDVICQRFYEASGVVPTLADGTPFPVEEPDA